VKYISNQVQDDYFTSVAVIFQCFAVLDSGSYLVGPSQIGWNFDLVSS